MLVLRQHFVDRLFIDCRAEWYEHVKIASIFFDLFAILDLDDRVLDDLRSSIFAVSSFAKFVREKPEVFCRIGSF